MSGRHPRRRAWWKLAALAAAATAALALTIDDWRRDLSAYDSAVAFHAADPTLRPFVSERSVEDLVVGLRAAAGRMGAWEYLGTGSVEDDTWVAFVRRGRVLRFIEDDVLLRIRDRGRNRVVTGESRSRLHVGDLGRNPRNLRRLLAELEQVLEAAQ